MNNALSMKNFNAFLQYCSCPKILMHLQYLCIFQYCTTKLHCMYANSISYGNPTERLREQFWRIYDVVKTSKQISCTGESQLFGCWWRSNSSKVITLQNEFKYNSVVSFQRPNFANWCSTRTYARFILWRQELLRR